MYNYSIDQYQSMHTFCILRRSTILYLYIYTCIYAYYTTLLAASVICM